MTSSSSTPKSAYAPSAPPMNHPQDQPQLAHPFVPSSAPNYSPSAPQLPFNNSTSTINPQYGGYNHSTAQPQQSFFFPLGTDPEIIRSFQMVDRDQSGFIEDKELQQALVSSSQRFSLRTIRLLMFLFKNPNESSLRIGPQEFTALWSCLGQWRAIFERFDRDRSGKIDTIELRDALHSLGYAIPESVLHVLVSRYDDGSGRRIELNFDEFIECGMVVKGLTDKFKEKDPRYTGSATLHYDQFMIMIIPFLVCD